ncbi:MAG: ATP-binding protein [Gemmatimonadaceae bacterium]|nr:ATP-binding protein [Gemmatimonadaceae bacterium]
MGQMRVALEVLIPSDVQEIERVVELVQHECRQLKIEPEKCSLNVPVALTEALSNAILRGNREDSSKRVRVRASVSKSGDKLVVDVIDEGTGFDLPSSTLNCTTPENIMREDGRGLYLMQCLVDRVEQFVDGGNTVRLTVQRG